MAIQNRKYCEYFDVNETYFPCIDESAINAGAPWDTTYPHETFVQLLNNVEKMLGGATKRSVWIHGAYGTGKSQCAYALKKILELPEEEVRTYWNKYDPLKKNPAFTSIITLYQCVEVIIKWQLAKDGITNKKYKEYLLYRRDEDTIEQMRSLVFEIVLAFVENTAIISRFLSETSDIKALKYRNTSGGNILFRPIVLTEYFNAAINLIDNGYSFKEAFSALNELSQELTEKPWQGFLWDGAKMVNRVSRPAIKNLLVYMVNKKLVSSRDYQRMITAYSTTLNISLEEAESIIHSL